MRILQINPIAGHSSTGRAVSELDRYFTSKGHTCYVACIDGYGAENIYRIGSKPDRKLHAFLSRLTGLEASFSHIATLKLIHHIKQIKPDVVRVGIIHSNYVNYRMLFNYLAKADIPTALVLNDCWHYTGKCVHYTENGCFRWKENCGNCPHLENGLPTWFFDRTEKLLRMKREAAQKIPRLAVVGVSDWITNEAGVSVLKSAKIIQRIYNWIDLKQFYPRSTADLLRKSLSLDDKYVILGVASSWKTGKGLEDFIRLAECAEEDAQIVLVGRVPEKTCLPERILHIQETHNVNELAELYSMADVFVSFSKEESFGKVSAEALACGTPVVCYDATACPEIVGHNGGIVVPTGDFEGIIRAIERIRQRGKKSFSADCVDYARKNFALEKSAEEYLQLFEKMRMM